MFVGYFGSVVSFMLVESLNGLVRLLLGCLLFSFVWFGFGFGV